MAEARSARLTDAAEYQDARYLIFQTNDNHPLGFVGGQYIIVNTGILLPGGKVAKRAYSIMSSDSDQHTFRLAVKRIGTGPGSNFMHALAVGSELTFSGPWGKFFPDENEPASPMLVFASDTGITAALGLLRSQRLLTAARTRVIWFLNKHDDFPLSPTLLAKDDFGWAAASLESAVWPLPETRPDLSALRDMTTVMSGMAVNHPERPAAALALLRQACQDFKPQRAFLSGDGAILIPLAGELRAMGLAESAVRMECFFNNPNRKAP